jgi:hypothetical protein
MTSTHNLRGRNIQLLHSENGFYATLTAQADADSNQQPESSKVRHATHSATRLSCVGNTLKELCIILQSDTEHEWSLGKHLGLQHANGMPEK